MVTISASSSIVTVLVFISFPAVSLPGSLTIHCGLLAPYSVPTSVCFYSPFILADECLDSGMKGQVKVYSPIFLILVNFSFLGVRFWPHRYNFSKQNFVLFSDSNSFLFPKFVKA